MDTVAAGQTFEKTNRKGRVERARVTALVTDYVHPWDGKTYPTGVRYILSDDVNGVARLSLPLDRFLDEWN